jgi:hypothetical protein
VENISTLAQDGLGGKHYGLTYKEILWFLERGPGDGGNGTR